MTVALANGARTWAAGRASLDDPGATTDPRIARSGAFVVNAEGSTGGSEMQGKDCVGTLATGDVEQPVRRVSLSATLTQAPSSIRPGRPRWQRLDG